MAGRVVVYGTQPKFNLGAQMEFLTRFFALYRRGKLPGLHPSTNPIRSISTRSKPPDLACAVQKELSRKADVVVINATCPDDLNGVKPDSRICVVSTQPQTVVTSLTRARQLLNSNSCP